MRGRYVCGSGNTRLTRWRVTSRSAAAPLNALLMLAATVCSTQIRKMHSAMPSTVLPVRIHVFLRCLRM